ncbi:uncharacterized protein [Dysidea avara]|uniref:uncharacterized protein n=1 Tax=Dysidea avara TaxID=196820 RepID=UPI00332A7ECE
MTCEANKASTSGGAIYSQENTSIRVNRNLKVTFSDNRAQYGGAVYSRGSSLISFDGSTTVIYNNNASISGGAIYSDKKCYITFDSNSMVSFYDNTAAYGRAVFSINYSKMSFDGNTLVTYKGNVAGSRGGAVIAADISSITFNGNSEVTFLDNVAVFGGAIFSRSHCFTLFDGKTKATFKDNVASVDGGAVYFYGNCNMAIDGNSNVMFVDNDAVFGGAMYFRSYSAILFDSTVTYEGNGASKFAGAIYALENSSITYDGNSKVLFNNNTSYYGGAVFTLTYTNILFGGNTTVTYNSDKVSEGGGAVYSNKNCNITFDVTYKGNEVSNFGGGVNCYENCNIAFDDDSKVTFGDNRAKFGGAVVSASYSQITFDKNSTVTYRSNKAGISGGAIYSDENSNITFARHSIVTFYDNSAILGGAVLSLDYSVVSFDADTTVAYKDNKASEHGGAIGDNEAKYGRAVFLGESSEISFDGNTTVTCKGNKANENGGAIVSNDNCSVTFNGNSKVIFSGNKATTAGGAVFCRGVVVGESRHQELDGTRFVPIACMLFEGISVIGKEISDKTNFSMTITSYGNSDTSIIKRGYWFGIVDANLTTVAVCPNNYCNFTCCETTDEFYYLSPVRLNQCSSHRCGTVCGSCEEGYTLSFDSAKCCLCMLDILLDQNLYVSQGLFTFVSIMSSAAKVTPQFLGQFCLVKNMSGIDQQVIHYVHPLAVTIIVGVICLTARMSYRFSAFVSRRIIQVICCLLLLSYTSVATTSLMLLRSVTFHNVNKVYTFLSPDIEYFNGRHLPFGIIAILCTLVIVISLPLLLLLEPFLNHKINFTRIKPLLDQFQGCYKDKYRSFAAYYMICRLVIVSIIIINSSNNTTTLVLLLLTSMLLALTQLIIKPYKHKTLNVFDGVVLQIMIFSSVISLFDGFNTEVLSAVIIILVILPIIAFVTMELIVYKDSIKKILVYIKPKPVDNNDLSPMSDISFVMDDSMRKNATIVDM